MGVDGTAKGVDVSFAIIEGGTDGKSTIETGDDQEVKT